MPEGNAGVSSWVASREGLYAPCDGHTSHTLLGPAPAHNSRLGAPLAPGGPCFLCHMLCAEYDVLWAARQVQTFPPPTPHPPAAAWQLSLSSVVSAAAGMLLPCWPSCLIKRLTTSLGSEVSTAVLQGTVCWRCSSTALYLEGCSTARGVWIYAIHVCADYY